MVEQCPGSSRPNLKQRIRFYDFQLLEFFWKVSHFFPHTHPTSVHFPLFPGRSDPHTGLLCLVLSCKLGKETFPPGRRSPARVLTAETAGSCLYQGARWIWASLSLWLETLDTVVSSGSLCFLCAAHRPTHVSAALLGDDSPAESYWVEQVLTKRQSSTVGTA